MTVEIQLAGRVAMVVGAGAIGPGWGNGKASAVLLARAGARVACLDVNLEAAEETAAFIRAEEGGDAIAIAADATKEADLAAAMAEIEAEWGGVDILHHNVGVVRLGGPLDLSEAEWRRVLDVNLTSAFLACRQVLPGMVARKSGAIVITSSIAGHRYLGVPYVSYSATKSALQGLARAVALEHAKDGVRVNLVSPGLMDTPMTHFALPDAYAQGDVAAMKAKRAGQVPMGFQGDGWDVARAVLWLASDAARYVTGQDLIIDGGLTQSVG